MHHQTQGEMFIGPWESFLKALKGDRRERFTEEQENLIMRRAIQSRGYSAGHWHRCDMLGTERPKSSDPETEKDRAMRAFVLAAGSLERSVEALKRLGVNLPVRSVG